MMKKSRKYIVLAIVAMFVLSTFAVVASAATDVTIPEYYYTISNGWHNTYPIDGDTVDGSLYCEYNDGVFSAPNINSLVSGYGDLSHVGLDLYMWTEDGDRFEDYDTADSSLELTVKAGFWDNISSTWHWGQVYGTNDEYANAQVFGE